MRRREQPRATILLLMAASGAGLCAAPPAVRADDWLALWPTCAIADGSRPELALLYPTPELPAVVHAGEALVLRMRAPAALTPPPGVQQEDVLASYSAELEGAALPIGVAAQERHRHRLAVVSLRPDGADSLVYRLRIEIPAYLADGTYSVSLRTPFGVRHAERAVRVLPRGARPRLRRWPAGAIAPPVAVAPVDVWISEPVAVSPREARGPLGDRAPILQAAGPGLALRVGDELWVRSGCDDSVAFEREVEAVRARDSLRRVALQARLDALPPPPPPASAAEAPFAIEPSAFTFDNRASLEPAELSLLLPFRASARVVGGTLAFFPSREPSARTPRAKLARLRVPAGSLAQLQIRGSSGALAQLALRPHRVPSGQPARVRVVGADAHARVAFAWGGRTDYASPSLVTSFSGPLAQPVHAQVFRPDGQGQVVVGHVWVEPHRPPNCAIQQLGGRGDERAPWGGAFWQAWAIALWLRSAKNARRKAGRNRLPAELRCDLLEEIVSRMRMRTWSNGRLRCLGFLAFLAILLAACEPTLIPNTRVEDTGENREVVDFIERYRQAVESRNVGALLSMASPNYFDDMGTPGGDDDIDYEGLEVGLNRMREEVIGARYQISYRAVTYVPDQRVLVDLLYTGWFRVNTAEGPQWKRRLEPHRIVLAREDRGYKIMSGM